MHMSSFASSAILSQSGLASQPAASSIPARRLHLADRAIFQHQTECHDPLAALRKDRGEKIFACHLSTCSRFFLTPKARRLHLIQAHGYPKEYFFAVTNKGVGGLLKRWGEGASLIRGQWKAREAKADSDKSDEDGPEQDGDESEHETPLQENTQAQATVRKGAAPPAETATAKEAAIDALTDSLGALALVPPSVRFGRGTRRGGFSHQDAGHNSHQQAAAGAQRGGLRAHSPLQTGRGATAVAADAGHAFSEDSPGAVATSAGADEGRTAVTGNGRGRARGLSRGMPPPRGGAIRMPGNFAMARGRGGARGTVMGPARGFASVGRGRGARGGAL